MSDADHENGIYILRNHHGVNSAWSAVEINPWTQPSTRSMGSDISRAERKKRTAEKKSVRKQRRKNR